MKIQYRTITLALFLLFCVTSCKDFLEEAPASNETRISTIDDYQDLLMGSAMQMSYVAYFPSVVLYDDDLDQSATYPTGTSTVVAAQGYHYTWQPDMMVQGLSVGDDYNLAYGRIKGCNAVLDGVDYALRGTQEQIDQIKAQALTLRAFYYLRLVNIFGKPYNDDKETPGVVLKTSANVVENGIRRSSVAEVYGRIVADLEQAIQLFKPYQVTRGDYHCNLPAAYILLSRTYLYMEDYQKSIEAASNAMAVGGTLTDLTQLSTYTMYSYDNSETTWLYGGSEDGRVTSSGNAFVPSASLLSLFGADDKRLNFWFNSTRTNNLKSTTASVAPMNAIRMAEAYLNRMESYASLGQLPEAMADLNTLRRNRIVGYVDEGIADQAQLVTAIRTERRKELCFELHRWFDLRRYGMPAITHRFRNNTTEPWRTYTLNEKDPLYTIPIAESYFDNNNKLEQNGSRNADTRPGVE